MKILLLCIYGIFFSIEAHQCRLKIYRQHESHERVLNKNLHLKGYDVLELDETIERGDLFLEYQLKIDTVAAQCKGKIVLNKLMSLEKMESEKIYSKEKNFPYPNPNQWETDCGVNQLEYLVLKLPNCYRN